MTTKTTALAAQITADASGLTSAFRAAQQEAKNLARASQDSGRASELASSKVAAGLDITVDKARKAAAGVTGVSQAIFALQSEGSSRVLAFGAAVGNFAELFGPAGALVTGVGVAASAIVALFLQAREEAKRTAIAVQNEIRALASSKDLAGLSRRQSQLFSGDEFFPLAADNASLEDRRRARGIGELGGLLGIEPKIKAVRAEVERLEKAFRSANAASAAVSAPGVNAVQVGGDTIRKARKELSELIATQSQLTAEYEVASSAVDKLTPKLVAQTNTAIQQAEASRRALEASKSAAAKTKKDQADDEKEAAALKAAIAASFFATAAALTEADREVAERQQKLRESLAEESKLRSASNAATRDEITALLQSKQSYEELLVVQAQATAIAEAAARAKVAESELTAQQIKDIKDEVAERLKLQKVLEALRSLGLEGGSPFALPTAADYSAVGTLADDMSRVASAASGIATAFGEAGRNMAGLLVQTANLLTNLNRAQRAGIFKDTDGKDQNVGFLGALSGQAGSSGVASAAGAAVAVVGGLAQIADALDLFGGRARERARAVKEAAVEFNRALDDFVITSRTSLEESLRTNLRSASDLANKAVAAAGFSGGNKLDFKSIEEIEVLIATLRGLARPASILGAVLAPLITELEKSAQAARNNVAELERRNAAELARLSEDLKVRLLLAEGLTEQADAERLRLDQLREVQEAESKFGEGSPYVTSLKDVQKQETIAAQAVKARLAEEKRDQVSEDVAIRQLTLLGRDRDAFILRQTAASREQLAEASRLVDAGTITSEMFAELSSVIGEELAGSIREFDEAAARATQRVRDDIAVRTLVAQGRTEEAEALRRQISNEEELRDITDSTLREQIIQAQKLEEVAIAAAEALDAALQLREKARERAGNRIAVFDLEGEGAVTETLAGYGKAFSDLFTQFDLNTLAGLEGAKEELRAIFGQLDSLSDDEIFEKFGFTRDELLSAILDADSGFDGLVSTLQSVADQALQAAQASQEFADSLTNDFLRSQGRDREADIRAATARRDERLKTAAQLGLGAGAIEQIEAIFKADLAEIAAKFTQAAAGAPQSSADRQSFSGDISAAPSARRSNTSIVSDFGGLSEVTAQSLAGLLRDISINTGDSGAIVSALLRSAMLTPNLSALEFSRVAPSTVNGGIVIQTASFSIQVSGLSTNGLLPSQVGPEVIASIQRELGRAASSEARFLGSAKRG